MSGVPGVRLRGVSLALDAINKTEGALRTEAAKLETLFGNDSPIVQRARGHAAYLRNIFDMVTADTASAIEAPSGVETGNADSTEGESAVAASETSKSDLHGGIA